MKVGSPRRPRIVPANVQQGHGFDSSDDENVCRSERMIESLRPRTTGGKRVDRKQAVGVHALVGVIRQAQLAILSRTFRTWFLKPFTSVRHGIVQKDKMAGASRLMHILLRTATVRGSSEFFFRLRLMTDRADSDIEWETAAEHIQKLHDLLGFQLLTSVVDKVQMRHIFSAFIALSPQGPEFIS